MENNEFTTVSVPSEIVPFSAEMNTYVQLQINKDAFFYCSSPNHNLCGESG
jgi:hypothetical protein